MMDLDEDAEWYPPSPPPYDVFDKVLEANQRLIADPTSSIHIPGKLRWRPDSRLVEIRWLVKNSSLDGSGESSEDVSSTGSSADEIHSGLGVHAMFVDTRDMQPEMGGYEYESDFADDFEEEEEEEDNSERSTASSSSSGSEVHSTKTSNGIGGPEDSERCKSRGGSRRASSPSSPKKTDCSDKRNSLPSRKGGDRSDHQRGLVKDRPTSGSARPKEKTVIVITNSSGADSKAATAKERNDSNVNVSKANNNPIVQTKNASKTPNLTKNVNNVLPSNSPYYETSASNQTLRRSRSALHSAPTIASAARQRSSSSDAAAGKRKPLQLRNSNITLSTLRKAREITPNRISSRSSSASDKSEALLRRANSLDRRLTTTNSEDNGSSDNAPTSSRQSRGSSAQPPKKMSPRSNSSSEIATKRGLSNTFSLPDLKNGGRQRRMPSPGQKSTGLTREKSGENFARRVTSPSPQQQVLSGNGRSVVLDKRKLNQTSSSGGNGMISLRPPPVLVRKISRNSLSSNSSTSSHQSGSVTGEDSGASSSDSSRREANDVAYVQWRARKREEKRLRERRKFIFGTGVPR